MITLFRTPGKVPHYMYTIHTYCPAVNIHSALAALFNDYFVARFLPIERQARRKLFYLNSVRSLQDLSRPLGNRLEPPGLKVFFDICLEVWPHG